MGNYRASNIAVAQVSISTLAPGVHNTAPNLSSERFKLTSGLPRLIGYRRRQIDKPVAIQAPVYWRVVVN